MYEKYRVSFPAPLQNKQATVYRHPDLEPKACILYFHGGGLLFGKREDLPELHLQKLTDNAYVILAPDYPLAPNADLGYILQDVLASLSLFCRQPDFFRLPLLPYFLWGRSAGAYLCFLALMRGTFTTPPRGLISYYGYGFLTDAWYREKSPFYQSFPKVNVEAVQLPSSDIYYEGDMSLHYPLYVYARQNGIWRDLFFSGRQKDFDLRYSLKACEQISLPLFCTHSIGDPDVPYTEFQLLCEKYSAEAFIAAEKEHDYDRNEASESTRALMEKTLDFLDRHCQP